MTDIVNPAYKQSMEHPDTPSSRRYPQKGYRFNPKTVRFISELQEILSEELGVSHVSQVMVVTIAIRNEHASRTKDEPE